MAPLAIESRTNTRWSAAKQAGSWEAHANAMSMATMAAENAMPRPRDPGISRHARFDALPMGQRGGGAERTVAESLAACPNAALVAESSEDQSSGQAW